MTQYNDNLTQIAQVGFQYNHIMTVSLVQRTPNMAGQNTRDYKDKFMFFVTFAPGINQPGGNRTYDFANGKITQKFSTREIATLAEVLYQCGIGNSVNVMPYAKFSRSNNNQKQLALWCQYKQQTISGNNYNVISINLSFSQDKGAKQTISLSAGEALGMSKVLSKLFDKAIELEMENFTGQPFQNNNNMQNQQNNQGWQPSQQPQNTGFNPQAGQTINNNMQNQPGPNQFGQSNPYR